MGRPRKYFFSPGDRVGDWVVLRDGKADRWGSPTYVVHCTRCNEVTTTVAARDLGKHKSTGCGCLRHVKLHEASLKHSEALQVGDTPAHARWQTMRQWFRREELEVPEWLQSFVAFRDATPAVPVGWTLQRIDKAMPWALDNMQAVPARRTTTAKGVWQLESYRRPEVVEARRAYRARRAELRKAAQQQTGA